MTTQIYNTVIIVKTALTRPPFSGGKGSSSTTTSANWEIYGTNKKQNILNINRLRWG